MYNFPPKRIHADSDRISCTRRRAIGQWNPDRRPVPMQNYFDYELALCDKVVVPLLNRLKVDLANATVLDAGCGYGGVIAGLSSAFSLGCAVGLDRDESMLQAARLRVRQKVKWVNGDFLEYSETRFDLVLLRDVLEHIGDVERALSKAWEVLKPGGRLYATFAPYFSPFGGHQHNGEGPFSYVPWLQLLPEPLFRRCLHIRGNGYKNRERLREDMDSVLATRLTLARLHKAAALNPWISEYRGYFLSRPDYRIKFGLPTIALPGWIPRSLAELTATGAEFLWRKPG